mgnify:CR=1 FL=1
MSNSYDITTHDSSVLPASFLPDFASLDEALKEDEWWMKVTGSVIKLDAFNKADVFPCYAYPDGVVIPSIKFLTKFRASTQGLCTSVLNAEDNGNSHYELSSNKYWELITITLKNGNELQTWTASDSFISLFKKDLIAVSHINSLSDKYFNPAWLDSMSSDVSKHIRLIAYQQARNNRIKSASSRKNLRNHVAMQIAGFINELSFMNKNYKYFAKADKDAVAGTTQIIHNEDKYLDLIG